MSNICRVNKVTVYVTLNITNFHYHQFFDKKRISIAIGVLFFLVENAHSQLKVDIPNEV